MREELRMALVLNGGVSLAVWMGGVVHELDLLRRASADGLDPAQLPRPYDQAVFDRWRELSRSGGRERTVVVDVIAGTSAGGINGSLLAAAVANKSSLDPEQVDPPAKPGPWLREQWAGLGALTPGQLLPDASLAKQPPSVLNGAYFLDRLHSVLGCLTSDRGRRGCGRRWATRSPRRRG